MNGVDSPAIVGEGIVTVKEEERIEEKLKHTKYRSVVGILLFVV